MNNEINNEIDNNISYKNFIDDNLIPFSEYEEFNIVITDIDSYEYSYGSFSNIDGDVDIRDDDEGYMIVNRNTLDEFLASNRGYTAEQVRDVLNDILSETMMVQNGNIKPYQVHTKDIISDVITGLEDL